MKTKQNSVLSRFGRLGNSGLIPGSGKSPGEGNSNPLQYLARKIPWTEKPGRIQSMGWQTVGHD